ncbi:2OF-Fe(II) oxygenase [Cedratvirus Zaza IHUMI]|uniref:2OF-Fe(II) oxygenase n=1 Tax=Cedratvirus Zaza IHUMI TaxID=2126979 RepID=A0A2R8FF15_9VIRU|nr:2OF-Fe(II) oxygenase [Cedratvirus Zaza IHUMI]
MDTITLTFGDVAENHKGMQKLGTLSETGFALEDLEKAKTWFEERGKVCLLINLAELLPEGTSSEPAYLLVVKDCVNSLCQDCNHSPCRGSLYQEQSNLTWDSKALMYGRVVNKKARHNLCFADTAQEADYERGKGTVIAFSSVPVLEQVRTNLEEAFPGASQLMVEGNRYYDVNKCYIGFHGDSERRKVIGLRLGQPLPLYFTWWYQGKRISQYGEIELEDGDLYCMSSKAVGWDWKKKNTPTLRHAAGNKKTLGIK